MLNDVKLMGRFTRDPELRYTNSQKPVASFTLAVDRDGKDNGTDFIDCVAWNGTAEFVSKYFGKGKMAVVSGKLQIRDWTDKDGNKRRSAEVVVRDIYFGDSNRNNTPANTGAFAPPTNSGEFAPIVDDDAQLPF